MKLKSLTNNFTGVFILAIVFLSNLAASAQTSEKSESNLARQYQKLAVGGKSVYISTDLLFEQVGFFFSDALEQIEKDKLSKNLEIGLTDALDKTAASLKSEKDGATREILTGNYAYLLTALRLLLPADNAKLKAENTRAVEFLISPDLRNIKSETDLIFAAEELEKSPILGYTEDYTQYAPRGRYASSEEQTRYFRAAIWLGRMGFYTEPNAANGIDEKRADFLAAQGAMLLKIIGSVSAFSDYDKTMTALVGASDDLTIDESISLIEKSLGKKLAELTLTDIARNASKIRATFRADARKPKILSTVAEEGKPSPIAVRLIGQRFTPDSFVFQNLTFSKVQEYTGNKDKEPFTLSSTADGRKVRGVPRVFDFLDGLGMRFAFDEIKLSGDDVYRGYSEQREMIKKEMPKLLAVSNFTTLYFSAIKSQDAETGEDARRALNSSIGAYVLIRRELAAYAKQSYTSIGRGLNDKTSDFRKSTPLTYVENKPQVFAALKKAVEAISTAIDSKPLSERARLLSETLQLLADANDKTRLPDNKAVALWKTIDGWAISPKRSSVIADVHTDLNSKQVLQIGIGQPQIIEAMVGYQKLPAVVFSTYEFRQPMDNRLTDEDWNKLLTEKSSENKYRLFLLLN